MIRADERDVERLRLLRFGENSLFWWNADDPLDLFRERQPGYDDDDDVMVEFDIVLNIDLAAIIDHLDAQKIYFVSDPILDSPIERYYWLSSAIGVYELTEMRAWLTCLSIFSNRAARLLLESRRQLG